ncbi:hypothetical protein [Ureibacillus sp. FSL K6-0786]|uniref:hypothetical protein n=1 Tax=Ureibacillus sp. FSL K6-0786 TaxID=2954607 RepID=UPI0030DCE407
MKKNIGSKLRVWLIIGFIVISNFLPYLPSWPTITAQAANDSIPMYDWTVNTLLYTDVLTPGPAGRQNGFMANHLGRLQWFGPLRYPTVYRGHVEDGATPLPESNEYFNAEGRWGDHTVYAYKKPFYYLLAPVDVNFAKPNEPVHPSEETETFNVQLIEMFDETDIERMFNGNPEYVLSYTPKYNFSTYTGEVLGTYYYIRELASYSGGEASNECRSSNETCLEIYQTDYPDITSFTLRNTNDYSTPNKPIFMDFEGFEYVANDRYGNVRDRVYYKLEVIEGPSIVGQKVEGNLITNKGVDNPEKPHMNRYDGSYISPTALTQFTPTAEGTYKVQLTITDAVMRTATATVTFTIGPNGGPGAPDDGGGEYGSCAVNISTNATQTIQSSPADISPVFEISSII